MVRGQATAAAPLAVASATSEAEADGSGLGDRHGDSVGDAELAIEDADPDAGRAPDAGVAGNDARNVDLRLDQADQRHHWFEVTLLRPAQRRLQAVPRLLRAPHLTFLAGLDRDLAV